MINKKHVLLVCCIFMQAACTKVYKPKYDPCNERVQNPKAIYQIVGADFNTPLAHFDKDTFNYDTYAPYTWVTCGTEKRSRSFFFQQIDVVGLTLSVQLKFADYNVLDKEYREREAKYKGERSASYKKWTGFLSPEKAYESSLLEVENENKRRKAIIEKDPEEAWQEELARESLDKKIDHIYIADKKGKFQSMRSVYKTAAEREAVAKDFFLSGLKYKKHSYRTLPDDRVKMVNIKGRKCKQYDRYERLPLPAHLANTALMPKNLEHDRQYTCRYGNNLAHNIVISMENRTDETIDLDKLIQPVLDSIQWTNNRYEDLVFDAEKQLPEK